MTFNVVYCSWFTILKLSSYFYAVLFTFNENTGMMAGISWDKLSTNLNSMDVRSPNALEQLLEEVNFQRKKDRRKCFKEGMYDQH